MKTAVEWLVDMLVTENEVTLKGENFKVFEQAKEMEKQQIIKAVYDSMGTNSDPNMGRAELYYNEKYNKSIKNKG